jgi:hypothetical protein
MPPPAGAETVATAEAAARLVASDPHAVTLLGLDEVPTAGGAVRAVPIASGNTADPDAESLASGSLAFPLVAITRGPARGAARSFVDWLRAPELDEALRRGGIVRR